MPLAPGSRLGPYEILAPIGAGGMGEVYRAKDTRLDREVAIKVLPNALGRDPERLARFEREAKVLATLNHPNIATIYAIEESPEGKAIAMELVPGNTLKGPLPLEMALSYAKQIAEALEAAHEKGVTHRDLKPANIMITPEGVIKVLDFGLASITQRSAAGEGDPSNSPTLTMAATQAGMIMGTAAYMSPEQASGKAVDRRADIWAFGVVLWEMLSGDKLFDGETISHTLADVLRAPIDFAKLPATTPAPIRELLKRCLDRDLKTRLQAIGEARIAITKYLADPKSGTESPAQANNTPRKVPWVMAALGLVATAAIAALHFTERPAPLPQIRFEMFPPEGVAFAGHPPRAAISPDGTQIAFDAEKDGKVQMWVRRLDSTDARPLPGSEGSETPFWSPDSKSVGLFADKKLKRVEVASGTVQVLCDAPGTDAGGSWSPDGHTILFSGRNPDTTVQRVAASGGSPTMVTKLGPKELYQRWPRFLPDGKHFFYFSTGKAAEDDGIFAASLDGGEPKRILASSSHAEFAGGYLFFRAEEALVARSFDPAKLELTGEPLVVAPSVTMLSSNGRLGFSVSSNGYLAVNESRPGGQVNNLVWVDRAGKQLAALGKPGDYSDLALSPDGRQLAFTSRQATTSPNIWVFDLTREVPSRITFDNAVDTYAAWTADGRNLLFASNRKGVFQIYTKPASGLGEEQLVFPSTMPVVPEDVSADGRFLLFSKGSGNSRDIYALPLTEKAEPVGVVTSPFDKTSPRFSPDGHWIAYASNESGRPQIYVRSFPGSERKVQVSTAGGTQPRWRRDGKELYYLSGDGTMMAVPIKALTPFEPGTPVSLFPTQLLSDTFHADYVVNADGSRFLLNQPVTATSQVPITIVQNWQAGLKK